MIPRGEPGWRKSADVVCNTSSVGTSHRRICFAPTAFSLPVHPSHSEKRPVSRSLNIGVVADFNAHNLVSILRKQVVDLGAAVHAGRAMGRRVEQAIISIVAMKAREAGAARLQASCVPTKKN